MNATRRVLVVLGLVVFVLGGAWYVARMSAAQEALERPPAETAAELAAMKSYERAFVYEVAELLPQLWHEPAEALRLGYQACQLAPLPENKIRDNVTKLFEQTGAVVSKAHAIIIWYRAKATICAIQP